MLKTLAKALCLLVFSSTVAAEEIRMTFNGMLNNDPDDSIRVVVTFDSGASDTAGQSCCAKYGPMDIQIIHGEETLSIGNAALNVDVLPGEDFEGIQWVDDTQPWFGTLQGQSVQTLSINFGRPYSGNMTTDLPLSVNLDDWDYHNGCFVLADGQEGCFELTVPEPVQLDFRGILNNDPDDTITVSISYSSDASNGNEPGCCAKYTPMDIQFVHGEETLSISNAGLNVDAIPGEDFEGIQWVDDGHPWSGTLLGQGVQTLSINFGRPYSGEMTTDLPLSVTLDDWDYHNGCFVLADGQEGCFELIVPEPVQLNFVGILNNDPDDPISVSITYSPDATNENGPGCCAKYTPMDIQFVHGEETLSISNAGLNVDAIPGEDFEGIQWVDDGQPWSGTLLGQSVQTLSINFGRPYSGEMTTDLPLSVTLDDWDYHNGCFILSAGQEGCFELVNPPGDPDDDGDGVVNNDDGCADTGADETVDGSGCSIAQYCPSDAFARHGHLVSCVSRAAEDFVQTGLMTDEEKDELVSSVARSKGKKGNR